MEVGYHRGMIVKEHSMVGDNSPEKGKTYQIFRPFQKSPNVIKVSRHVGRMDENEFARRVKEC